jgi:HPt (histidine-containing phosphotransfer) domain-containing protein
VSEPVLDPAAFAHLLEITGDDLEFVDELVDTYLDDAVVQLLAMREAADAGDADAIVRPAHSLKSGSANVGAPALTEACRSLEADGRSGVVPDLTDRVAACERMFEDVRSALLAERSAR